MTEKQEKQPKKKISRIHQVAKELGFSSSSLVSLLKDLGYSEVKSHMSTLSHEMRVSLDLHLNKEKNAAKKEYDDKKEKKETKKKKVRPPKKKKKVSEKERRKKEREEKKKKRQQVLAQLDETKIRETVKKTLAKLEKGKKKKTVKKKENENSGSSSGEENVIYVPDAFTVSELAEKLNQSATTIIKTCIDMGYMVTINQRLDFDTIKLICENYNIEARPSDQFIAEEEDEETYGEMEIRPPIVTIMGHVDHGKTTLLDYIRSSNVVAGEKGGITQHTAAYQVETLGGLITFIDTPGHEAFTAMRARGANITDIVVLVVAANDSVMPQTIEAINHARAAGIPIIVAINKVDLADANPDKTKKDLSGYDLLTEDWGGDTLCVEISALKGNGVDELLEMIILQAEMMELSADYNRDVKGYVIEGGLSKGQGPTATVLVQHGMLKRGDAFVAGTSYGKVRAMYNERNERILEALPATPVIVTGFSEVPNAGDSFFVTSSESEARNITSQRSTVKREELLVKSKRMSLTDFHQQMADSEKKILKIVLKTDYFGSAEAIRDQLQTIRTEEASLDIIHTGVGSVTEYDVLLAAASNAVVIGFNVKPDARARDAIKREHVDVKSYGVIYELQEDIIAALEGLLEPEVIEKALGTIEVRQVFHTSKVGDIAGSYVKNGTARRNAIARVYRRGNLIIESTITSLKRFKEDVAEVAEGYECGVIINDLSRFEVGDIIEVFETVEIVRKIKR